MMAYATAKHIRSKKKDIMSVGITAGEGDKVQIFKRR